MLIIHRVPFGGVWTVIYVYGTHVDIFLVTTCPDSFDFKIKLRQTATRYLMIQIGQ